MGAELQHMVILGNARFWKRPLPQRHAVDGAGNLLPEPEVLCAIQNGICTYWCCRHFLWLEPLTTRRAQGRWSPWPLLNMCLAAT